MAKNLPDNLDPAKLLRILDVPDPPCKCRRKKQHVCVTARRPCAQRTRPRCFTKKSPDGCSTRRKTGTCLCPPSKRCDCPYFYGKACKHILARDHALSFEQWADLLLTADYEEYRIRDPAPFATLNLGGRKEKIEIMARRVEAGFTATRRDLEEEQCQEIGTDVERTVNGTTVPLEFRVLQGGDAEGDADDADLEGESYWNQRGRLGGMQCRRTKS